MKLKKSPEPNPVAYTIKKSLIVFVFTSETISIRTHSLKIQIYNQEHKQQ